MGGLFANFDEFYACVYLKFVDEVCCPNEIKICGLVMTVEEFEHKLSENGWKWLCWNDVWEKDGREISFPELNMFKGDFKVLLVSNVKILYKDETGCSRIVSENELNDIV